jgi:hypothetical protein
MAPLCMSTGKREIGEQLAGSRVAGEWKGGSRGRSDAISAGMD